MRGRHKKQEGIIWRYPVLIPGEKRYKIIMLCNKGGWYDKVRERLKVFETL